MSAFEPTFDRRSHDRLIGILAASDYPERYFALCSDFGTYKDIDGPRLDLRQTANMFRDAGVEVHLDKRFRVFTFDAQEAAGWTWRGKLVVQKYDMLEPMFGGATPQHVVGSTMLALADDAAQHRVPLGPATCCEPSHPNRPRFDGDMRTMERMVPELVALVRWMRELIAKSWAT